MRKRSSIPLLVCLLSLAPATGPRWLAYWTDAGRGHKSTKHVLVVCGKETTITAETPDGAVPILEVKAYRSPKGAIYGSSMQIVDGAALWSIANGFGLYRGKLKIIPAREMVDHRGEYALFLPILEGMEPQGQGCSKGILYERGKLWEIGWVRRAKIHPDGSVTGWYPVVNRKAYEGYFNGDRSPGTSANLDVVFEKRYFRWKAGKRAEANTPFVHRPNKG